MKKINVALVRGPFLRANGVHPWDHLHQNSEKYEITSFESDPAKFDTSELDMPVRSLPWIDGWFDAFGIEGIFDRILFNFNLPHIMLYGMRKICKEYDLVHTSGNYTLFSLQAAIWSKFYDTKFVFSEGQNIPYPMRQRNYLTWKSKSFINSSADGITNTTIEGKRAMIHEGASPSKIKVVPNALDFENFDRKEKTEVRGEDYVPEPSERFTILFVHGLKEQKGTPYLLEAFEKFNRDKNARLILVGDNKLKKEVHSNMVKSNKDIIHIDYIPNSQISRLYNLSDLFILPSVTMKNSQEQFGMSVLESMACGVPSIVTDVGGLPHVVENGKTSLVVDERSVNSLAEAIEKMYDNPGMREEMGEYAYEYVRKVYCKKNVANKLESFYDEIV